MSGVVPVVMGIIDIIQKNLISKTNVVSNALTGEIIVNVENTFNFSDGQEIILIDYGYNNPASPHYQKYEYTVIDKVINTHYVSLTSPIVDPSGGWYVADGAFIQKTIGHAPLYDDRVYYGDREVIPSEEMAVTVEPVSISNEWIYMHGGLSEEYRISIMVYGKDIETEQGMQILNLYADAIYEIFNRSMHIDIDNYKSPLLADVNAGSFTVIVADTPQNRIEFQPSYMLTGDKIYEVQDNIGVEIDLFATSVTPITYKGQAALQVTLSQDDPNLFGNTPLNRGYNVQEYAFLSRHGRYFYDSRIDGTDYGMVQKGSAFIRAAKLNWFGKQVTEYKFPQQSLRSLYFKEVEEDASSSSSGI